MHPIAELLMSRREELFAEWLRRVQQEPPAKGQPVELLRDHLPELIDHIAHGVQHRRHHEKLSEITQRHAELRQQAGYNLRQLIGEYQTLRSVMMDALRDAPVADELQPAGRAVLHEHLDTAIMEAVSYYVDERDRTRRLFMGVLSHDLKSPLNGISLMTQQLSRGENALSEKQTELVEGLLRSAQRMQRMIDQLMDFIRGKTSEGFYIVPAATDLRRLVSEGLEEVAAAHPERDLGGPDARTEGDFHGKWDDDRLQQVFTNLLNNAVTHGFDPIRVAIEDHGEWVAFEVVNQGMIDPDVRERLFDPFRSTSSTDKRALGLGLYISYEIIRAHGGRIEVDSTAETGTRFRVLLPRYAPAKSTE